MQTSMGATTPQGIGKSWFDRNWKWFVPCICLAVIALILAFVAAVFGIVETAFKSSGPYIHAMAQAQTSSQVSDRIGQPLKPGWFVSGSININGDSGDADISIPISGPKGKGEIYVVANKIAGDWQYKTLQVAVDGQPDRIDLLQAPPVQ